MASRDRFWAAPVAGVSPSTSDAWRENHYEVEVRSRLLLLLGEGGSWPYRRHLASLLNTHVQNKGAFREDQHLASFRHDGHLS